MRASGLSAYVSISSGTLREAMANSVRYGALDDTGASYAVEEAGNVTSFRVDTNDAYRRSHRQTTEFKVAFIIEACRHWVKAGFRPLEVRYAHPRSAACAAFERHCGCPVRFAAESTEMLVSSEQLDLPVRGADPHLLALLRRHGDVLLSARAFTPETLRARVERRVLGLLPKGVPSAREIASAMGLGERTFTRRLAGEGASYRQVVDDLRRDTATGYLADPELSLGQIAYLLGYSDQSAFTNAFRRWTGQSPRRFRAG